MHSKEAYIVIYSGVFCRAVLFFRQSVSFGKESMQRLKLYPFCSVDAEETHPFTYHVNRSVLNK